MTSKPVAFLLAGLGVTKTRSRPHVSNDNPYSESQFKTMKYRPEFPERFGSYQDAHRFCSEFSLVQSRASSQWLWLLYAVRGALWVSRKAAGSTQRSAQGSLRKKPPAFCAGCAKPRAVTDCGVDQQAQRIAFNDGQAQNSQMTGIEQKNGFNRSPLTNDRPPVRGMGRAENQPSEDLVQ